MEGDEKPCFYYRLTCISIHSLRMEGDFIFLGIGLVLCHFNPLPPHGGRPTFLVFRPVRQFISIHSLRMEGDTDLFSFRLLMNISIHSLRMEGDFSVLHGYRIFLYFNPLPPHGGRRCRRHRCPCASEFQSTPSAWRETSVIVPLTGAIRFQSTPSAWRETKWNNGKEPTEIFQSTPSAWRETVY